MAKQLGTVLVFKSGVNSAKAAEALRKMEELLEPMYIGNETFHLHSFDPDHGYPVWYVP